MNLYACSVILARCRKTSRAKNALETGLLWENGNMSFVHLHTHTEFSLLDGLTRIPDLVRKCADSGMPSVAVTDHGNMFGVIRLLDACEEHGGAVKPIFGCEVYVAPRSRHDRKFETVNSVQYGMDDCMDPSGNPDAGYHLVLLAKNAEGFTNLSKLVTLGFTEGFYYKPRVDKEILGQYSKGLICLSACLLWLMFGVLVAGPSVIAQSTSCHAAAATRSASLAASIFFPNSHLADSGMSE